MKSTRFKEHRYIGDPLNAVRIFNGLQADELMFLDISASRESRSISPALVRELGEESDMPFAVGGGINSLEQIHDLVSAGAEKVVIGSHAVHAPDFVEASSRRFGSSTLSVCIDVKSKFFGGSRVWSCSGTRASNYTPVDFARLMEEKGAGEIVLQSIVRDGMMDGYDLDLVEQISNAVRIPLVALGGAGKVQHLQEAARRAGVSGLGAGSMFVYHGPNRGVLINYPDRSELRSWFTGNPVLGGI